MGNRKIRKYTKPSRQIHRKNALEWEIERLESTLNQVDKYIEKMSYSSIVDNPKKDLQKILKKEKNNE